MNQKHICLIVGIVIALFATSAQSATVSWTSTSAAGANWTDAANWGGTAPVANDSLVFSTGVVTGGTKTTNNNFAEGTQFNGLTFNLLGYTLAGNGIKLGGNINAANTATLALTMALQQNVTITASATLYVTSAITGNYGITKEGTGSLDIAAALSYLGDTVINAGTLTIRSTGSLSYGAGAGNVYVNTGATLNLRNTSVNFNGLNGGGLITTGYASVVPLTVGNNNANGNFSGTLQDGGPSSALALTKTGTGTQTLSGSNTYTGGTTVKGGTLLVNGTNTGSAFTVTNSGSVLGGTGKITPGVSHALTVGSGAIVAPGSGGIGTLTVDLSNASDTATFLSGAKFTFELAAPGHSDQLAFTGLTLSVADVTFNGNVIDFTNAGGLAAGTYTLFTFDANNAYSGTLAIGTGLESFSSSYLTYNANSIMLTVVPEPSTTALLAGVGVIGLLIVRRRRQ
jgi:autotransporter-associated beta strand protein